jgi:hypothetical protein
VVADLVPLGDDPPGQFGVLRDPRPHREERGLGAVPLENVQQPGRPARVGAVGLSTGPLCHIRVSSADGGPDGGGAARVSPPTPVTYPSKTSATDISTIITATSNQWPRGSARRATRVVSGTGGWIGTRLAGGRGHTRVSVNCRLTSWDRAFCPGPALEAPSCQMGPSPPVSARCRSAHRRG